MAALLGAVVILTVNLWSRWKNLLILGLRVLNVIKRRFCNENHAKEKYFIPAPATQNVITPCGMNQ